jgi:hypothetical protein
MATSFLSSLDRPLVCRSLQDGKSSRTTFGKSSKSSQVGWMYILVKANVVVKCKAGPGYGIEKI